MNNKSAVVVVAPIIPGSIRMDEIGTNPIMSAEDKMADALDLFNKPRLRRAVIMKSLEAKSESVLFQTPLSQAESIGKLYADVHSEGLLEFLTTAWANWVSLGVERRDPCSCLSSGLGPIKPLILSSIPLPRDHFQRSSNNVMGQMAYYCTDAVTPITETLLHELTWDSAIIQTAVDKSMDGALVYAMPTHPGHHAAKDSFGGYCYLNQAAFAARLFQSKHKLGKIAVLDIDYHCGNGTASIFYDDPSVLVVSLHCDPDFDYPFHSGFSDQVGVGAGVGTTLHLPMPPKTQWEEYQKSLETGLQRIEEFGAEAVVISMGLDTHEGDPCALPGTGFVLQGRDYWEKGRMMARSLKGLPTVIIQEGGYRMDTIGEAASNVVLGFYEECERV